MDTFAILTIIFSVVTIVSVVLTMVLNLKVKNISLYWIVGIFGAIILLIINYNNIGALLSTLIENTPINPLKILVIFISMTIISIMLDCLGLFKYLANKCVGLAKGSQFKLFIVFYIFASILTLFTSNDIIILSVIPFLCYFCKASNIDVTPYVFSTFVAANTWSMFFIFGNPTNIYVASFAALEFMDYFLAMVLPTFVSGIVSFLILMLLFRKKLKTKIEVKETEHVILDKPLVSFNIIMMLGCIVMMSVASYIGLEMWYISLAFALFTLIVNIIICLIAKKDKAYILETLKKVPWNFIPFLISMFLINMCFQVNGITGMLAEALENVNPVLCYGSLSFIFANIMNNIPMTAFFASMLAGGSNLYAVYATNIGSSICALFTPIGSLAGIMFLNILRKNDIDFSFKKFVFYGSIVSIPTLILTLSSLFLVL